MQGTLTCIFAPSVIIVPALSGLACPGAQVSTVYFILKCPQPQAKWPYACGWCMPVDAMILITFSVDLGRLPDMTTMTTPLNSIIAAPAEYSHTTNCLPTYKSKKNIYNILVYDIRGHIREHVYLIFSPNDGLHLCVGTPQFSIRVC